jgi:hypothetical protein
MKQRLINFGIAALGGALIWGVILFGYGCYITYNRAEYAFAVAQQVVAISQQQQKAQAAQSQPAPAPTPPPKESPK